MINIKKKIIKIIIILFLPVIIFAIISAGVITSFVVILAQGNAFNNKLSSDYIGLPQLITKDIIIQVVKSEQKYKVPASITLAQIILESSGSYPKPDGHYSRLAWENKNLFGMKGKGTLGSSNYKTKEFISGSDTKIDSDFAKYRNFNESIDAHGKLLSSRYYAAYVKNKNSSDSWADALQGRYATNPDYANSLKSIMKRYNLYKFDDIEENDIAKILESQTLGNIKADSTETDFSKKIISSAAITQCKLGWCEKYVGDVYNRAGYKYQRSCCANKSRITFSKKYGDMPVGAIIYASSCYKSGVICPNCKKDAGHVGIYIGNGKVSHANSEKIWTLKKWYKMCGYGGWSTNVVNVK